MFVISVGLMVLKLQSSDGRRPAYLCAPMDTPKCAVFYLRITGIHGCPLERFSVCTTLLDVLLSLTNLALTVGLLFCPSLVLGKLSVD